MLPWNERIVMLSIHPDAASRDDAARLATELMEANRRIKELEAECARLRKVINNKLEG